MARLQLEDLPTPALVINVPQVRKNIEQLNTYAKAHNLKVRPHTKTHKSQRFARMQLELGCAGLTVAKVGEAEVMAEVGNDLFLAYPALDPARTRRLAKLALDRTLRVGVDSALAIEALAAAARSAGSTVGILVDYDIGFHRTGVQTKEEALALAQLADRTQGVRFDGMMTYPGHIWLPVDQQQATLAEINARMQELIDLWAQHGLQASIVTGGSTPTAFQSHFVTTLTEIRPGTTVFYDRNSVAGGYATLDQCAARVLCTVVSDAVPGKVVLDAGSKTLTSDRLAGVGESAGYGLVVEHPEAKLVRLSEEHGELDLAGGPRPRLGSRVWVVPNHICPCVNLQSVTYLQHEDGSLEQARVDARGLLS